MNTTPFRKLESSEEEILCRLLSFVIPDQDYLTSILNVAVCRSIDAPGYLDIEFPTAIDFGAVPRAAVAEGDFVDIDRMNAHFILHVKTRTLLWLEWYKDDGSDLLAMPKVSDVDFYSGQQDSPSP